MKLRTWTLTLATTISAALLGTTLNSVAQAQNSSRKHHHYRAIDLGTFGGPTSAVAGPHSRVLSDRGMVIGWADSTIHDPFDPFCLSDACDVLKSFVWRDGELTELPSLTATASSIAVWENDRRSVVGASETGFLDTTMGTPQYAAVLWRNGMVKDLGTLGGASSVANAVNNLGQVVGGASNGVADDQSMLDGDFFSFGIGPANTQSHAFLWKRGAMLDLGTLGGSDSMAIFNNDRGQVVGISYSDHIPVPAPPLGGFPAISTFLWQQGKMINIGGFGGHFTIPLGLNQRGEIVGTSLLEGDQVTRSFIWRNGTMKDMGSLGGDNVYVHSVNDEGIATGYSDIPAGTPVFGHPVLWKHDRIVDLGAPAPGFNCAAGDLVNAREQVVGIAGCNADGLGYPFLWEKSNPIVDLNSLLVPGDLQLDFATSINDRGEIAGNCHTASGNGRACLLVPLDDDQDWNDEATAVADGAVAKSPKAPTRSLDPHHGREGNSIRWSRNVKGH